MTRGHVEHPTQRQGGSGERQGLPKIAHIDLGRRVVCGELGVTGWCGAGKHGNCAQASYPAAEYHAVDCPGHDFWRCPCACHRVGEGFTRPPGPPGAPQSAAQLDGQLDLLDLIEPPTQGQEAS